MRKILATVAGVALAMAVGSASAAEAKGTVTQIESNSARVHVDTGSKVLIFSMSPMNTAGVKIDDLVVGDEITVFYSSRGSSEKEFNAMHVAKDVD